MSKAILWDNDGVLTDTEQLFYQANREVLARHGVELGTERYIEWFMVANSGAWHLLAERGYDESRLAQLRDERNARYAQALREAGDLVRPGIPALLSRMRARARMAIVTASFGEHLALAHGRQSFLGHFDVIVTREDAALPKPAPDCYLRALDKLALPPSRCIAVEDSPRGLAAAGAAGLPCIVIRSRLLWDYPFAGALAVVDDAAQLEEALDAFLLA